VTGRVWPRGERCARLRGERGQSLFEAVAVVGLLGVVLAMVYAGIANVTNAVTGTERRLVNLDEARTLMAVSTKDIRTATRLSAGTSPFVTADKTQLVFYGNLNSDQSPVGPRKIRIYVDANSQLIEQVTKPDATSVAPNYTYNTNTPSNRYVGRYVANPASQPIFQYYDQSGNAIAAPVTGSNLLAIYSVKVTLAIRKSTTYPVGVTTVVNQVRLPNVDYQQVVGG
jgi:hypothetical protein